MPVRSYAAWPEVAIRFLRLGLTAFGGPVAHLGYFRREFVDRARWLDDETYGEVVGLCSVLPGPTSSQVGMVIGALRAGPLGAVVAWLAFTTPSAVALALFAAVIRANGGAASTRWGIGALDGLAGAAAAVVALAVVQLAQRLATTGRKRTIALFSGAVALAATIWAPSLAWLPILLGALAGVTLLRRRDDVPAAPLPIVVPRAAWIAAAAALVALLFALPLVHASIARFATPFVAAGTLVFGGGHVVLPILRGLIPTSAIDDRTFFAGYGAAQAVPGPLFTVAAFLGAAWRGPISGALGAFVATIAIFLPSFLMLAVAIPLWSRLRRTPWASAGLAGIGAAVVGMLGAAFLDPIVWRAVAERNVGVVALALVAGGALIRGIPPWAVVLACAALGALARA